MWAIEIDGIVRIHAQTVEAVVPGLVGLAAFLEDDLGGVKNVIMKRVRTDDPDLISWMDVGKDSVGAFGKRNLVLTNGDKTVFVDGAFPVRSKTKAKSPRGVFDEVEFATDWVGKERESKPKAIKRDTAESIGPVVEVDARIEVSGLQIGTVRESATAVIPLRRTQAFREAWGEAMTAILIRFAPPICDPHGCAYGFGCRFRWTPGPCNTPLEVNVARCLRSGGKLLANRKRKGA